jgi:hypothetical protein
MQYLDQATIKEIKERIRWWMHHPVKELIYLLGGVPKEHINTAHYRNVRSIFKHIQDEIDKANGN